eukprot:scaffold239766_cov26-Tisochrysis_lutea.AAC.2
MRHTHRALVEKNEAGASEIEEWLALVLRGRRRRPRAVRELGVDHLVDQGSLPAGRASVSTVRVSVVRFRRRHSWAGVHASQDALEGVEDA